MITININSIDRSDHIDWSSVDVRQNLTHQVDTLRFRYFKGDRAYTPAITDEIEVYDDATKIFGGQIVNIDESVSSGAGGLVYNIDCIDHTYEFDSELVAEVYESQTVEQIIAHIVANYTDGSFTINNVVSTFLIDKVVFNQVEPSKCLKRLAKALNYYWYIDPDKDVHFFPILSESAPFEITDDNGNTVYKTMVRKMEGSQIANRCVVRGGLYNEASTFTDEITVSGSTSLSFTLPYRMANLAIRLNTGAGFVSKTVGTEFLNDFTSADVLYNYQDSSIRFETALADGDIIEFSGNRKVRVISVAEDSASIAQFGRRSKILRDNTIEDLALARKRAQAEIQRFKDAMTDLTFRTRQSGLNAGMTVHIESALRGIDVDYIISSVNFRTIDPNTFEYNIVLVNTISVKFQELLAMLLEPDAQLDDETEVSETIQTDIEIISITESIALVEAVKDVEEVTISETITNDPLGAGVAPVWVLAPYTPSPYPTDTKRPGRLDISMELY